MPTETPDEEAGSKATEPEHVSFTLDGKIRRTPEELYGWKYWLLDTARVIAGVVVSCAIVLGVYVLFYDPIKVGADGIAGVIMPDGSVTMHITGTKRHDRCPGEWRLIIQRPDGSWDSSDRAATGALPTGLLNAVPITVIFDRPLSQELHKATAIVQYYCLLTFRHQFSFTLEPYKAASDTDPEGLSWLGPRRACLCPARGLAN